MSREPQFRTSITDLADSLAAANESFDDLIADNFDIQPTGLVEGC